MIGSKRHKFSVLLRKKGMERRGENKSMISLQKCFGVAGEGRRKDKIDPPITTRD